MSLAVKHLNADTTFLLTFSPNNASAAEDSSGSYTILLDPWLSGHSSLWNPRFQISHHTIPSCVESLADIFLPDAILISQVKPDHCHRETLCSLPRNTPVTIYAVPDAAKMIKSWRYFQTAKIVTLAPYSKQKPQSVQRVFLKSEIQGGDAGEITISHVPEKGDITGLHNALAITYRPPGTAGKQSGQKSGSADGLSVTPVDSGHASPEPLRTPEPRSDPKSSDSQIISIIYTPHGIKPATIAPYINNHLRPINAFPLTALFHGLNIEQNPWLLGGQVARGLPSGITLAKDIGARYWVIAHDELKINEGWSTLWLKSKQHSLADAQAVLDQELDQDKTGVEKTRDKVKTKMIELDVGEEFKI